MPNSSAQVQSPQRSGAPAPLLPPLTPDVRVLLGRVRDDLDLRAYVVALLGEPRSAR